MRLRTDPLRRHRGDRTLAEIGRACDVSAGLLSMLERGRWLPDDEQAQRIAAAYGAPVHEWFVDRAALLALAPDEERQR